MTIFRVLMALRVAESMSVGPICADCFVGDSTEYIRSPLMEAILAGRSEMGQMLVHTGADINGVTPAGVSCLMMALYRDSDPVLISSMISRGAYLNQVDLARNTVLHYAAHNARMSVIAFLLNQDLTQLTIRNLQGETPRMIAQRLGRQDVTRLLAPHEMRSACVYCDLAAVNDLLNSGFEVNSLLPGGHTCIWYALRSKNMVFINSLLQRDARIELGGIYETDRYGRTLLHSAVLQSNEPMVRLLVSSGAILNCKDNRGNSPLSIAARQGQLSLVSYLLGAGATLDSVTSVALRAWIREIMPSPEI